MKSGFMGRGGALDGLRFLAAFAILVYHYASDAPVDLGKLHPIFSRGFIATDFFLMLSGYVVTRAYGRDLLSGAVSPSIFMARRLKRIWPGHLVVCAAMAALVVLALLVGIAPRHPELFNWRNLLLQVALLHGFGVANGGGVDYGGWNTPTWTLSALLPCYALTPMLLRLAPNANRALPAAVVLLAAFYALPQIILHESLHSLHVGVLRALPLYVAGMAVALFSDASKPLSGHGAKAVAVCAALALVALQAYGRHELGSALLIGAVLLAAGARPVSRPSKALETAARISFALFLTHVLTSTVWFGAADRLLPADRHGALVRWAVWLASFPLAIAVAFLFDRLVDQPIQQWLRRYGPQLERPKKPLPVGA
jgi:peptidoglycan/LPS O-acetylase OafA/YrhL